MFAREGVSYMLWLYLCLLGVLFGPYPIDSLFSLAGRRPLQEPVTSPHTCQATNIHADEGGASSRTERGGGLFYWAFFSFAFPQTKKRRIWRETVLARQGRKSPPTWNIFILLLLLYMGVDVWSCCVQVYGRVRKLCSRTHLPPPFTLFFFSNPLLFLCVFVVWLFYRIHSVHISYILHGW